MPRSHSPIIKVTCQDCGDTEISVPQLSMRVCADTGKVTCHFRCPLCAMVTVKDLENPDMVQTLCQVGVSLVCWTLPRELGEHRQAMPKLSLDDLILFEQQLESVNSCGDIPELGL